MDTLPIDDSHYNKKTLDFQCRDDKQYDIMGDTGLMVSNLYIAQVKKKCGIEIGKNYNKPKSESARQSKFPAKKKKAIKNAVIKMWMERTCN